jgi:hypothetical protein
VAVVELAYQERLLAVHQQEVVFSAVAAVQACPATLSAAVAVAASGRSAKVSVVQPLVA